MRKKKLLYSTIASLTDECIVMICAIILPKFFLLCYGSTVNGLVASVTQFLSFIAFLDFGVGAVVQSSIYRPLVEHNTVEISKIMASASKFFKNIARIFIVYVIGLIVLYPLLLDKEYSFSYTGALIGAIAITQFAQYYFGITNQLLLNADQKSYIPMGLHIIVLVLNTVICIVLMKLGASIQVVQLFSSFVFLIRPIGMSIYIKKHYEIDRNITYDEEPIRQKWNGLAQHLTAVVLDNTDIIILTMFSTLKNVSIYSVYYLVVHGIRKIIERLSVGMESLLGELYAKEEESSLNRVFQNFESLIHAGVVFLFSCTGVLVVPFIMVYTAGIEDANYYVPVFGMILTLAQAAYCLRIPYMMMVKAAGHYKETQTGAIIEMGINIMVSLLLVGELGLVGVAAGTLCAMLYRTIYLAQYSYRVLLHKSKSLLGKHLLVDAFEVVIILVLCSWVKLEPPNYFAWIVLAIPVAVISLSVILAASVLFYRSWLVVLLKRKKSLGGEK